MTFVNEGGKDERGYCKDGGSQSKAKDKRCGRGELTHMCLIIRTVTSLCQSHNE